MRSGTSAILALRIRAIGALIALYTNELALLSLHDNTNNCVTAPYRGA